MDEKPSVFKNFADIVSVQGDEGYVNLANDMGKKIPMPTGSFNGSVLIFNPSTGKYEAGTVGTTGSLALNTYFAAASATTACTVATADVTGATITLGSPGKYLIFGFFFFTSTVAGYNVARGFINVNGAPVGPTILMGSNTAADNYSVGGSTVVTTATAGLVAKLTTNKTGAGGTVSYNITDTYIQAIQLTAP